MHRLGGFVLDLVIKMLQLATVGAFLRNYNMYIYYMGKLSGNLLI